MNLPARIGVALLVGVAGLSVFDAINYIGDKPFHGFLLRDAQLRVIGWIGLPAVIAGLLVAAAFGRPGGLGAILAVLGALAATVLGAALSGTVIVPGVGSLVGAVVVVTLVAGNPAVLAVWVGSFVIVHAFARKARR